MICAPTQNEDLGPLQESDSKKRPLLQQRIRFASSYSSCLAPFVSSDQPRCRRITSNTERAEPFAGQLSVLSLARCPRTDRTDRTELRSFSGSRSPPLAA